MNDRNDLAGQDGAIPPEVRAVPGNDDHAVLGKPLGQDHLVLEVLWKLDFEVVTHEQFDVLGNAVDFGVQIDHIEKFAELDERHPCRGLLHAVLVELTTQLQGADQTDLGFDRVGQGTGVDHQTRSGEREGLPRQQAVQQAILLRARPVYMSTLTSLFGMLPLMLIPGVGAEIYRGLATVIVGGMAISALFTLILLPAVLQMQRLVSMRIRSATVAAQGNSHV